MGTRSHRDTLSLRVTKWDQGFVPALSGEPRCGTVTNLEPQVPGRQQPVPLPAVTQSKRDQEADLEATLCWTTV